MVGLFAFALVLSTQAAAARSDGESSARAERPQRAVSLEARLGQKLDAARRYRGTMRFFRNRPKLLTARGDGPIARAAMARAKRRLVRVTKQIAYYRREIARHDTLRLARRLAKASPRVAIRAVFGRYAEQAIAVAWCESQLTTTARNGQYLGLFQMGWNERRLFGHGATAHQQALAAHRYFVASGRDWSPWSCRWAAI